MDEPRVYDARGNGDGGVAPTMTGDHQSRITDYTAIVVEEKHEDDGMCVGRRADVADHNRPERRGGGQRMPDKNNFTAVIVNAERDGVADGERLQQAGDAGGHERPLRRPGGQTDMMSLDVYHMSVEPDGAQTLKARDYKDPQTINDDRGVTP